MKQIAQQLGISRMTVSRALRHAPGVGDETRERVLHMAKKMGFIESPLVAAWMKHVRSGSPPHFQATLAYCIFREGTKFNRTPVSMRNYLPGVTAAAESRGFRVEPFWLEEDALSAERIEKIFNAREIHGLIIHPLRLISSKFKLASWSDKIWKRFSVIALGYTVTDLQFNRVCSNHYQSMCLLLDSITSHGYTRPGLILKKASDDRIHHMFSAAFLRRHGTQNKKTSSFYSPEQLDWIKIKKWLDNTRPDIVLSFDPEVPDMLGRYQKETGIDIHFGHLDGEYHETSRTVVLIDQNSFEIGSGAAHKLMDDIVSTRMGIPAEPQVILVRSKIIWKNV